MLSAYKEKTKCNSKTPIFDNIIGEAIIQECPLLARLQQLDWYVSLLLQTVFRGPSVIPPTQKIALNLSGKYQKGSPSRLVPSRRVLQQPFRGDTMYLRGRYFLLATKYGNFPQTVVIAKLNLPKESAVKKCKY